MGPSEKNPNSGRFVANQYRELSQSSSNQFSFFYLTQDSKNLIGKLLRYPFFFLRFFWVHILSRKKFDVIHVHFFFPTILLAIAYKTLRNRNIRIVTTFHGSDIYKYSPPNKLYLACYRFVDKTIFVSDGLKSKAHFSREGEVLSAGILDVYFEPKGKGGKVYDFLFVGHIELNKGIDRLVSIANHFPNSKIAVVGAGKDEHNLRMLNLKNLTVIGSLSPNELIKVYRDSKYLVSLSRNESFGLVMTEAMATGLPVIATITDGSQEQVFDGKNGFLLPNIDEFFDSDVVKKIQEIMSIDSGKYDVLCENAKESASKYQLKNVIRRLNSIYDSL